jgi:antitoxin component YwqK of YwqJK toxin-antitoxin module
MKNSYKYLIGISFSLLLILALIQKNAFVKREILYWSSCQNLSWSNFRGYPVYLTVFGAGIHCLFDYEFESEAIESIKVRTFMHPHHSWVIKNSKTPELLEHEQYHFNISEVIARRFRKILSELSADVRNKESIKKIYKQHLIEMNKIQMMYDIETDHGLNIEIQKDWEYIIDSMLVELEFFRCTYPLMTPVIPYSVYFRKISVNAYNQIIGRFPIDSITARHTRHYKFDFSDENIKKIEHRHGTRLVNDEYFGAAIIKITTSGNTTDWQFYDRDHSKFENLESVHLINFLNEKGTLTETYFDQRGNKTNNNEGIHKITWKLDSMQRKHIGRQYDINGYQVNDSRGFYIIRRSYDANDNIVSRGNYNERDELVHLEYSGSSYFNYEHDLSGNMTAFYSFNEKHMLHPFESNIASGHFKYDPAGNITRSHFKDVDGNIVYNDTGAAISYFGYDSFSNKIDERHFGLNRNLIIKDCKTGGIKYSYDSNGRITSIKNFDAYGRLLNNSDSVCSTSMYYSGSDFIGKIVQYYSDSLFAIKHFRTIVYEYDDRGKIIKESYFNENSVPEADTNGVSMIKYLYDERNNLIQGDYFNTSGNKQPNSQGIVGFRNSYDSRNNIVEALYIYENGDIAIDLYFYNNKNQLGERRYYDPGNETIINIPGDITIHWKYDVKGNIISETYINENGELAANLHGVAKYEYLYNDRNTKTEVLCYNINNQLVVVENDGVARIVFEYSNKNNLIKISFFDKDNFLIDTPFGYAIEQYFYDDNSNRVKTLYFSKTKNLVKNHLGFASIEMIYDLNRNTVAVIFRDEYGYFVENEDGFAICNWVYDRNGNVIESYGFDANRSDLPDIYLGAYMNRINGFNSSMSYSVRSDVNSRYQLTFYDNGQKESEVLYKDGRPDGIYKSWYETGELQSVIEYNSGFRDGKCIDYYKNGNRSREVTYIKNFLDNESEVTWYETGNIRSMYVNGSRVEWDINGNITSD